MCLYFRTVTRHGRVLNLVHLRSSALSIVNTLRRICQISKLPTYAWLRIRRTHATDELPKIHRIIQICCTYKCRLEKINIESLILLWDPSLYYKDSYILSCGRFRDCRRSGETSPYWHAPLHIYIQYPAYRPVATTHPDPQRPHITALLTFLRHLEHAFLII
jgi:hypothetical protein